MTVMREIDVNLSHKTENNQG